jgi:hypothetical protein
MSEWQKWRRQHFSDDRGQFVAAEETGKKMTVSAVMPKNKCFLAKPFPPMPVPL